MINKTLIIAEAGVNHNGDIKIAKKLIDIAANAGVDYVKFQTFKASKMVTKYAKRAVYQDLNTNNLDTQYQMLKNTLPFKDWNTSSVRYEGQKGRQ